MNGSAGFTNNVPDSKVMDKKKYCCKVLKSLIAGNEYLSSPIGEEDSVFIMLGQDKRGYYVDRYEFVYCPFCGKELGA